MKTKNRVIRRKKCIQAVRHNTVETSGERRNYCVEQFGWGMYRAMCANREPDRDTAMWMASAKAWDRLQTKLMIRQRNPFRGKGVYRV